jgi:glycosyltransferase involved in cell wall biosynthesis
MLSWKRERKRALFLLSATATPCGVEMFARGSLKSSTSCGIDGAGFTLDGRLGEIAPLWSALADIDALIVNLPMVAWKRTLLAPALALLMARLRGARTIVTLHEWGDLDWRRRLMIGFYLSLAQTVLFSSPYVRAQFARSLFGRTPFATGLVPIPANIERPHRLAPTAPSRRLAAEKGKGRLILGHFGSIYPKKQPSFVLDVAAELKLLRRDVFVVFIGGFVRDSGRVEADFRARASALGLSDDILVTGYIETNAEIFSLFESVDVFAYSFAEGLTSRRGSILACLQSGRPVVVNQPTSPNEFDHHPSFQSAMAGSAMRLVPTSSTARDFATAINAMDLSREPEPIALFEEGWRDAALAISKAISSRPAARYFARLIGRKPTP